VRLDLKKGKKKDSPEENVSARAALESFWGGRKVSGRPELTSIELLRGKSRGSRLLRRRPPGNRLKAEPLKGLQRGGGVVRALTTST